MNPDNKTFCRVLPLTSVERPLLVHHVAKLTGCSRRTVRHWAQTDQLQGFKLGKKIWGFWRAEVVQFLGHRYEL